MEHTAVRGPSSVIEAVLYFSDPERSVNFVKDLRWPDGKVTCPRCGHTDRTFISTRRIWKCRGCRKQFSLKVGTIFEDSPLGWDKWLPAVWLLANSKNSISSHELGRALGVTQKTAWFVLHRLRDAMATGSFQRFTGTTEVDDTFIGGKAEFMHEGRRRERVRRQGSAEHMAIVHGARNRDSGHVAAEVIQGTDAMGIQPDIYRWVEPGSPGDVSTNGIENFWSVLKRSIKGSQIHVDPAHLQRYVNERVCAFNHRDAGDRGRMRAALAGTAGRRLTWAELTASKTAFYAPKPWQPRLFTKPSSGWVRRGIWRMRPTLSDSMDIRRSVVPRRVAREPIGWECRFPVC
jgi:transposase-like protein